jgi:TRAP transporter TAXI family solute receptor
MKALFAAIALVAVGAVTTAHAQPYNYALAGASPSGLWSSLGVGVDKAVKAQFPGSTITYQTSGGGLANIGLLDTGKAQIGIAQDPELKLALEGAKPFAKPITSMRAIAYLYDWGPMQIIVTKDFADKYGLKTFEDIATKKPPLRVTLNRRGNIAEGVAIAMFKAIGVTPADIEKWGGSVIYAASQEQADLYKDRRADMMFNSLFVKQGSLLEATNAVDSVMLPVSEAVIKKVVAETGAKKFVIPANSYKFQTEPMPTTTLGAGLIVNASMDDQTAYNFAQALHKNIGELQAVHGSMKALTPQILVEMDVIPYHPGAVKYYKEAGLMK